MYMRFFPKSKIRLTILLWTLVFSSSAFGQLTKIMGTVTDSLTGEPLPFVNIVFRNNTQGVTTDFDGKFAIETKAPGDSLTASFMGYYTQVQDMVYVLHLEMFSVYGKLGIYDHVSFLIMHG